MKKDLKTILAELKAFVFNEAAPVGIKATDAKGKDGKAYTYDKLEAGGVVMIVTESGEPTPAEAGSIELEDGTVITVTEGGVISEVKAPEAVEPAAEPIAAAEEPAVEPAAVPAVVNVDVQKMVETALTPLWEKIYALENLISAANTLNSNVTKQNEAFAATLKLAFEAIDALANESTEKPTNRAKHSAFADAKNDKQARVDKLANAVHSAFPKKK